MGTKQESEFLTGKLLIAMPGIGDPRFARTVIFICSHSEEAAMGLILNRPAPRITFPDLLQQLEIEETPSAREPRIMFGGPVERSRGFVLHSGDYRVADATLPVTKEVSMTASIDILRDIASGGGPAKSMLALGYSGWGPGQLEDEIRANGWLTADADEAILFGDDDAHKWNAALAKLGIDARMLSSEGGMA